MTEGAVEAWDLPMLNAPSDNQPQTTNSDSSTAAQSMPAPEPREAETSQGGSAKSRKTTVLQSDQEPTLRKVQTLQCNGPRKVTTLQCESETANAPPAAPALIGAEPKGSGQACSCFLPVLFSIFLLGVFQ